MDDKWIFEVMSPYRWIIKFFMSTTNCSTSDGYPALWENQFPGQPWLDYDPTLYDTPWYVGQRIFDADGEWEVVQEGVPINQPLKEVEMLDCYWDEEAQNFKKTWKFWYECTAQALLTWIGPNLSGFLAGLLHQYFLPANRILRVSDLGITIANPKGDI